MAGIGFELNKMISRYDGQSKTLPYCYSAAIIAGTTIICIFILLFIKSVMRFFCLDIFGL